MSYQRKPFVCRLGNIECHGTIEEHTYTRPDNSEAVPYYKVGVVVAGIRSYRFTLHPNTLDAPHKYVIADLERMSAVRETVMEAILAPFMEEPLFPDLAFEAGLKACVAHYEANPPRFAQAFEHLGEL